MLTTTRLILTLLGVSAIAIGLMVVVFGPDATARIFSDIIGMAIGSTPYVGGLEHVNVDSEMRFFSVFWIAYGAVLLWLSTRLVTHAKWVYAAIALFFSGGVARLFSLASLGWPDPLLVGLMTIELTGPIIVAGIFTLSLRADT